MSLIHVRDLRKGFHVSERAPGMVGAFAGLVRRRHRIVEALAGVTFDVEAGEIVGYIGPNGAGKSTTIKVLSGILVPDGGECLVGGRVPWLERMAHVRDLGVVFGQRTQLWWDLPVTESFDLLRAIYRVPRGDFDARRELLVELLGIGRMLNTPVRQLSLGERMRCDIAAALLHGPRILFLDEPTIGLDAPSKLAVRDFVLRLVRDEGTTVILTTHDLDDIEALCTRVLVIAAGRVLMDGTLDGLRRTVTRERRLTLDLSEPAEVVEAGARIVSAEGSRVVLTFDPATTPAADLVARIAARYAVRDLFIHSVPIDEIVAILYAEHAT
jgi:ABC-2 type transport system ATP-binding protein